MTPPPPSSKPGQKHGRKPVRRPTNLQRRSQLARSGGTRVDAGTEPTETCPIHNPVIAKPFRALAALFGLKSAPNAAHAPAAAPPQQAAVIEAPPPPKVEAKPEQKKRGFWSRVFGVNKDDEKKKRE